MLDDPHERLTAVVDRARRRAPLPATERVDANRVHGCVSVVWFVGEAREGIGFFRSDAESAIVRGLVGFLSDFFSGAPLTEVAASDIDPLESLGVTRDISPTRRNGLAATRQAMRAWAQRQLLS